MAKRTASVMRKTRETDISLTLNLDGSGKYKVDTGMPFLNHMLELLSKHSLIDLSLKATGDLKVDYHHTVEDIGICFGEALDKALGKRHGIGRYGWAIIPMDESVGIVAVDLGGRPFLVYDIGVRARRIGDFELQLVREFFRGVVSKGRMNLHVVQPYGDEPHHAYEAIFKAVARSLRLACALDRRVKGVPSSKGRI